MTIPAPASAAAAQAPLRAPVAADYQLAPFRGARPAMPDWAREALATLPARSAITVEGARIEVLAWGGMDLPGLLLLHGSRASADWWAFTAPLLMRDHRVVALSLSGMGGSDWRDRYSVTQHAREAMAVARTQGLFEGARKPIVIAHSFGGYAALAACLSEGERIGGVVLVDTILRDFGAPPSGGVEQRRTYATVADALARFRLVPPRVTGCPWALDEIARRSMTRLPETGAWSWRFDPAFFARLRRLDLATFAGVRAPVAVVRGEHSAMYGPDVRRTVTELFGTGIPDVVIPQAGHHVMIDQPLGLVTALRALLTAWPAASGVDRRSRLGEPGEA